MFLFIANHLITLSLRCLAVKKSRAVGYAALLTLTFLWGTTFPFIKIVVSSIGFSYYVLLRFSIASLLLLPIAYFRLKINFKETLWPGFVLGMLFLGGIELQGLGMEYTTASNAAFITGLSVVLVYVFEVALGRERFTARLTLAVLLSVIGVYLLSTANSLYFRIGDLIVFIGAVFWAFQIIAVGIYARKYDLASLVFYEILFTSIGALPIALFFPAPTFEKLMFTLPSLLYLAVACTIVTNSLQLYGQKYVSSTQAAIIYLLEPVFAAILSYLILGEVFTLKQTAGSVLILLAMALSTIKTKGNHEG